VHTWHRRAAARVRILVPTPLALAVVVCVAGCGASATPKLALTRAPGPLGLASGGPLAVAGADWRTLMRGPSHFGAASVTGPSVASVRWRLRLGGSIVAGPVAVGDVAYVASTLGVLDAIDIASGRVLWSFDGGAGYGSDLSSSPTVLADGLVLWPGPRHRLFALTPHGRLLWTLSAAGEALTPAVDQQLGLLVLADTAGQLRAYRLSPADRPPVLEWSRALAKVSYGSPALGADGTI
jgi:hypothetical protein